MDFGIQGDRRATATIAFDDNSLHIRSEVLDEPRLVMGVLPQMGLLHDQVTVSVTRPDWPVWS